MKKYLIPFILIFFLASCNPWKYVAEYNHDADFNSYKTFGLLNWDPQNDKVISPETKKNILMAIKSELESRGYTYQKNNADLQVSVFAIAREESSYSAYMDHYSTLGYGTVAVGVGVGSGGAGVGVGVGGYGLMPYYPYNYVKHDYSEGTVIVDLLDRDKKIVVWQGVASGRIADGKGSKGSVDQSFRKLFSDFPKKRVKK